MKKQWGDDMEHVMEKESEAVRVLIDARKSAEEMIQAKIRRMSENCHFGICDGSGEVPRIESLVGMAITRDVYKCRCAISKRRIELYKDLINEGNMELYRQCQLDTYKPKNKSQSDAFRLVNGELDSFYFVGPVGVGKTHLMAALINREIRAGRPAALITVPQLIAAAEASRDSISELERLCYTIPCLGLDDIGKEKASGYMIAKVSAMLFRIIDHRALLFKNKRGHTSFTSQWPRDVSYRLDEAGERMKGTDGKYLKTTPDLSDKLDEAIVDRIRGITIQQYLSGPSQRKGR